MGLGDDGQMKRHGAMGFDIYACGECDGQSESSGDITDVSSQSEDYSEYFSKFAGFPPLETESRVTSEDLLTFGTHGLDTAMIGPRFAARAYEHEEQSHETAAGTNPSEQPTSHSQEEMLLNRGFTADEAHDTQVALAS